MIKKFPSPIGESYFSIMNYIYPAIFYPEEFPSPIGESYFSIIIAWYPNTNISFISVPYRGILFFNFAMEIQEEINSDKDFRPLSGNLIFQYGNAHVRNSPAYNFRPLSGNLIFQSEQLFYSAGVYGFPSPIGESYFSIPSPTPACSSGLPGHFAWERDFSWNS